MKKVFIAALLAALLLIPSLCLCESEEIVLAENEYLGVSENGMSGNICVKVTLDGDTITAIDVLEQHETRGIGTTAILKLIPAMISANSTEVDSIAGATITTNALKEAVNQALVSAGLLEAPVEEIPTETAAN